MQAETAVGLIEFLSKGLALLGAVCLCFSVVYDWGYLYGLGLNFREIPTSLADHLRSAIIWLPYTMIFVVFIVPLAVYLGRKDVASTGQTWNYIDGKINNAIWITGGSVCVASWILLGDSFIGVAAVGIGLFVLVIMFLAKRNAAKKLRAIYFLSGLSFFGASVLFGFASIDATSMLHFDEMDDLLIKRADASEVVRGVVLRRFDHCVIFISDQHVVTILRPDDLLWVTIRANRRTNRGALCEFFGILCRKSLASAEVVKKR